MNWLYYLAEANIYMAIFYLAYRLFLTHDTHYQLGRCYLLFSCIISFLLPVMQLGALKPGKRAQMVTVIPYSLEISLPAVNEHFSVTPTGPSKVVDKKPFTFNDALFYTYITGVVIFFVIFGIKLYSLYKLATKARTEKNGKNLIMHLPGTNTAFSFFNFIFIGGDAPVNKSIMIHELVHVRQKHSADILFTELIKIVNWFNPVIYLLQNSLKTVHEYIADEQTAAIENDPISYSTFLLKNLCSAGSSSITHSFFNNTFLKKRIIMLNQQRSGSLARLNYLVALPICAALLCASTLVFSKTYGFIDLAPTKFNIYRGPTLGNSALVKISKHLKITQNGVTTIADKISVGKKDSETVYTVATITPAARSSLLKDKNIKVEIVADTAYTTKDGKPILPIVNTDGYYLLDHFLHNYIQYTAVKGDKGGLVEVEFGLDDNRHITNLKIVKSGGVKLDALAMSGFNAYKGIVNDDPGKKLKLGVYFFTDDYSIFKTDSLGKDPEFGGELIITTYKYPTKVTNKGYEYDESYSGFGEASKARVIIYSENSQGNWYYKDKCTAADLKTIKDTYGYTFPSASYPVIQQMDFKKVKNKRLGYIFDANSYLNEAYSGDFYHYIMDSLKYPQQAQKEYKGGVVVLSFNLDKAGMINNIKVAKGSGKEFDNVAVKALQAYKQPINDSEGMHTIAISFCVAETKYHPVVEESVKTDGYVGELAVSDIKSPIVFVAKTK